MVYQDFNARSILDIPTLFVIDGDLMLHFCLICRINFKVSTPPPPFFGPQKLQMVHQIHQIETILQSCATEAQHGRLCTVVVSGCN